MTQTANTEALLPELPDPDCQGVYTDGFTMAQMEAYAREAIALAHPAAWRDIAPVAYRYRHSENEKWHYGEHPQSWWECQALFAHPAEQQEGGEAKRLAELVLSAVKNRSDKDWTLMHLDLSEAAELARAMQAMKGDSNG